ncbi:hypothetical protein PsYK624_089650 [Phanerochaete sordida]|uniref:Uncharacterized protein n=1 Tax=Phanerochaete sordida TaxID=48140 RepID=A0A9P3GB44_9APHY|nr:hypothetical protein PsYK624_089650 [Phanerochaete sordida]
MHTTGTRTPSGQHSHHPTASPATRDFREGRTAAPLAQHAHSATCAAPATRPGRACVPVRALCHWLAPLLRVFRGLRCVLHRRGACPGEH